MWFAVSIFSRMIYLVYQIKHAKIAQYMDFSYWIYNLGIQSNCFFPISMITTNYHIFPSFPSTYQAHFAAEVTSLN